MKKVSNILIFLATFAIFGISTESFAKNRFIFSSQTNEPSPAEIRQIARLKRNYKARGGSEGDWTGSYQGTPTLSEARALVDSFEIARLKRYFLDNGGSENAWSGTGDQGKPTLKEAQKLRRDVRLIVIRDREIQRLKTEYDALGGSATDWKGSFSDGSPNLSEAQALLISILRTDYLALGGSLGDWTGTYDDPDTQDFEGAPTLSEAQKLHNELIAEIQKLKTDYLARGGSADAWTGTYNNPATPDVVEKTPTLSEAQTLHSELVAEIQRLKTEYLAFGGTEGKWTSSYNNPETSAGVNTPTLSEAQALVELLKNSTESSKILIISLTAGISGALVLGGGIGYWFYRRHKKS